MPVDADVIADRRRLKRRLSLWRVAAIVAGVALAVVLVQPFEDILKKDHVARLRVEGLIVSDPQREAALAAVADEARAKALIVRIDSPGGTFVGGEALHRALLDVAREKPVVAVLDTVATSAAYMAALAADHIVTRQGTVTGSVGVMLQTTEITGLLEKLGVSAEAIKSTALKATPSPLEPLTDEGRAAARAVVDDMHGLFVTMVADRRALAPAEAEAVADGRVYTGRQALERKLVDALGGEAEARDWLDEAKGVPTSLPVREVTIERPGEFWRQFVTGLVGKTLLPERLTLDGLVSFWHPDRR
ncbi:MAG: signal peptide peptidase SppA [Alphaproteobacteria bacterium]